MNPAHLFLICVAYWVVFGLGFACRHSLDSGTNDDVGTFIGVVAGLVCIVAFVTTLCSLIRLVTSAL